MAESGGDGPKSPPPPGPAADTPGKAASKLEALSKEDLIKFVKKQMLMVQKTKARCEGKQTWLYHFSTH